MRAGRLQVVLDLLQEMSNGEVCWESANFWVFWGVWSMLWCS